MIEVDRIKERAKELHLSVAHVCARIGVNRGFLRDVESGKCQIKEDRLLMIANILETTPEYLKGETDEKNVHFVYKVSVDIAEIVERIKNLAKERHRSIAYICDKIGVNQGYIKDLGNGRGKLTDTRLAQIADILETTPEYLKGETDEKNKPTLPKESELTFADGDIGILIQFYKSFSPEDKKALVSEAFRIWMKENNNNQ